MHSRSVSEGGSVSPTHQPTNSPTQGAAYKKVAEALSRLSAPVRTGKALASGKEKVQGIGKASGEKIDEYLVTGKIEKLEQYRALASAT